MLVKPGWVEELLMHVPALTHPLVCTQHTAFTHLPVVRSVHHTFRCPTFLVLKCVIHLNGGLACEQRVQFTLL